MYAENTNLHFIEEFSNCNWRITIWYFSIEIFIFRINGQTRNKPEKIVFFVLQSRSKVRIGRKPNSQIEYCGVVNVQTFTFYCESTTKKFITQVENLPMFIFFVFVTNKRNLMKSACFFGQYFIESSLYFQWSSARQ